MLEIRKIRENKEPFITGLKARNFPDAEQVIQRLLDIDQSRRDVMLQAETLRAEAKKASAAVSELMKAGQAEAAEKTKAISSAAKSQIAALEQRLKEEEDEQTKLLLTLPNTPHPTVPFGKSADDNVVVSLHGSVPDLGPWARPHWEILDDLDIVDFALGAKITGAGFPVYKGQGAAFLRALKTFFLDEAIAVGYMEVVPPLLVNEDSGYGTGQIPDKEGQMYYVPEDKLYLIPTAEVPVTNLYRDVIVDAGDLPIKNCAYSQCFRREAGAYGSHVRGLNRLHQFDKVEIVELSHPDTSYERHEAMLEHARGLLDKLGLHHRVLLLCSGDMGFASAKTYDLEVWSGAQQRWLEVSSVSCFETFQSNRLKLRFKDGNKNTLCHTLNGSALAFPRIMAAILENFQNEDGTVTLPKVLQKYTGFEKLTKA
ncbi:MAG: serine--tRNA ligase [Bacteroidia bacterium]|nr:serine--tRNA ligase [Bacteroidia bacterium]